MKSQLLIPVLFSFALIACADKQNEPPVDGGLTIKVDVNAKSALKFENMISMEMLHLEMSEEYPLGHISKLIVSGQYMYILDIQYTKAIFIYDRYTGKLKQVIRKLGNGPGEYAYAKTFDLQADGSGLMILDGMRILRYDSIGNFISDIDFKDYINRFILSKDNRIVLDRGNGNKGDAPYKYIGIADMEGKIEQEMLPRPDYVKGITITPYNPLQKYVGDTILYMPSVSNRIYQIADGKIQQRYLLDYGVHWPNEDFLDKQPDVIQALSEMSRKDYVLFPQYLETPEVLHLNYQYNGKLYSFYYNKRTKQSVFVDDKAVGLPAPIATIGNSFVSTIFGEESTILVIFNLQWP
ncbi:MAG: 6-bladed beta-propeller [Prevotellaceae bacterium]|jgi:hypothetical protein|nr:6-bladed beta-propeller [Prevotellaceae bacterium]